MRPFFLCCFFGTAVPLLVRRLPHQRQVPRLPFSPGLWRQPWRCRSSPPSLLAAPLLGIAVALSSGLCPLSALALLARPPAAPLVRRPRSQTPRWLPSSCPGCFASLLLGARSPLIGWTSPQRHPALGPGQQRALRSPPPRPRSHSGGLDSCPPPPTGLSSPFLGKPVFVTIRLAGCPGLTAAAAGPPRRGQYLRPTPLSGGLSP